MRLWHALILALLAVSSSAARTADLGRETLTLHDGWGSMSGGTTGGATADAAHVFRVSDRRGFVAALQSGDVPKIIYVDGDVEANVDDDDSPLACANYETNGYTLATYVQAFDPGIWGTAAPPAGPLEDARVASHRRQSSRVQIPVGSNTTIVGVGDTAFMLGVNLVLRDVDNVIIRNLNFSDAFDCFPQWDPTDGPQGNWNAQYDNISLIGATHVWIDHNAFDDGNHQDAGQPVIFGRPFQVHDGAVDITRGSDLVTVSWNAFVEHDKTMLIGATDNPTTDVGKLRVSVHHNLFAGIGQRAPRVRFGQVHVYNNVYDIVSPSTYGYTWGVGVDAKIFAENNIVLTTDVASDQVIRTFNGTALHESGTLFGSPSDLKPVDLVSAYNATHPPGLSADVGWAPTTSIVTRLDSPSAAVVALVRNDSGPISH